MNSDELNEVFARVATQFFDITVNPLAGMICTFLEIQVRKGHLTKDEAKAVIISSLDLINETDHAADVLENGHDMLLRMIRAIERMDMPKEN